MTISLTSPARVIAAEAVINASSFIEPDTPLNDEQQEKFWTRTDQAMSLIQHAGSDSVESMRQRGWYATTDVLRPDEAIAEAARHLSREDCPLRATRTRVGYIIWKSLQNRRSP